jgi:hypothetical protein
VGGGEFFGGGDGVNSKVATQNQSRAFLFARRMKNAATECFDP